MIVAIWGRGGTGKSTLADALGVLFAKAGLTAVIDTDLTQPTLPVRLPGKLIMREDSLGKNLSGAGTLEAKRYLKQHPKAQNLFYAGLSAGDDYLSYELHLDAGKAAAAFVKSCADVMDTVILDCSGQRTDPFIPSALKEADVLILPITPDPGGVCWYNAVKKLLDKTTAPERICPVSAMTQNFSDVSACAKAMGFEFSAILPYVRELPALRAEGALPNEGTTFAAGRYMRRVKALYRQIQDLRGDTA